MSSSAIGRRWYRLPTTWQVQNDLEAAGALSAAKLATESSNENIALREGGSLLHAPNAPPDLEDFTNTTWRLNVDGCLCESLRTSPWHMG